jgi:asparagine synthase (glutamine-hydrolysing)
LDPTPASDQPWVHEDGTLALVFNGEIYNFPQLRSELEARGRKFRSHGDTETIVRLYESEGEDAFKRLDGIYALALWDGRAGRLLLARDPVGVKPLYFAALREGFLFASELKALLAHEGLPRGLDGKAFHQYLSLCWATAPLTPLAAVQRLRPGALLRVDPSGRVISESVIESFAPEGGRLGGTFRERTLDVRGRVMGAVRRQMLSDVPVGAFLSGGVDSTTVVAGMRAAGVESPTVYTVGFPEGERPDENPEDLPWARLVAKQWGLRLREVPVPPIDAASVERMVFHLDEPQPDPACLHVSHIAAAARADGIKVLLSGAGGDDLYSGYRRHTALYWEQAWSWLPPSVRRGVGHMATKLPVGGATSRRLHKYLEPAGLDDAERMLRYFLWHPPEMVHPLYGPVLRESAGGADALAGLRETLSSMTKEKSPLRKMLHLEVRHFLADHNLNYTDKMAMAHGVEVRVPLLDLDLVRHAALLPASDRTGPRGTKRILREAMKGIVPDAVLRRPKTGFGAPLRRWIREDLREMVRDTLAPDAVRRRGLFDADAVVALLDRNERGRIDASYLVFGLVCAELWCRSFLDGGGGARGTSTGGTA